jgi:hypothetical protein
MNDMSRYYLEAPVADFPVISSQPDGAVLTSYGTTNFPGMT